MRKYINKFTVYLIGGAALLLEKLKPSTKDIDLIINTQKEFECFKKSLISIHFKPSLPTMEYKHMELNSILVRNDYRIDVFLKKVCNKFILSQSMIKRSHTILNLEYIHVKTCSYEDIFLFKCMTERDGDLDDCITLAKRAIRWNDVKEELTNQITINGQHVWITWVGERLDILEKRGLIIPIMKEVNTLRNEYFSNLEKKYEKNTR
jgi:hypothetical protein